MQRKAAKAAAAAANASQDGADEEEVAEPCEACFSKKSGVPDSESQPSEQAATEPKTRPKFCGCLRCKVGGTWHLSPFAAG